MGLKQRSTPPLESNFNNIFETAGYVRGRVSLWIFSSITMVFHSDLADGIVQFLSGSSFTFNGLRWSGRHYSFPVRDL